MKKLIYTFLIIVAVSCNSENAIDCFQTAGTMIQEEFNVGDFEKILVHKKVAVILKQGPNYKVVVETGENLLPEISVDVTNNKLTIRNNNNCNFVRAYGITKVYVTAPNITEIRNASEQTLSSDGVLTYPSLYIVSVGDKSKYLAVGDIDLHVENETVKIWSNGVANLFFKGSTNNLDINFSNGDTRFEGQNLIAKNVNVTQVSSNDMLVFPTERLTGSIHSTGSVISYNIPPLVDVDVQSQGQLIFKQ